MSERIGIVGSRKWPMDAPELIDQCLRRLPPGSVVVTGDCPTGVDALVARRAPLHGFEVVVHCADWKLRGKAAGPIRNRALVADCDWLIAFLLDHAGNRGTGDAIRQARAAHKTVWVVNGLSGDPLPALSAPPQHP